MALPGLDEGSIEGGGGGGMAGAGVDMGMDGSVGPGPGSGGGEGGRFGSRVSGGTGRIRRGIASQSQSQS